MNYEDRLINLIIELNLEFCEFKVGPVYNHIGAIIIDSILQAGLNYKTVVYPRVKMVLEKYMAFSSVSDFIYLMKIFDLEKIILWKNERKIKAIKEIFSLLHNDNVDDMINLQLWLSDTSNITKLLCINGVGLKTVDYFKKMVGIDVIPIDRHLIKFLELAQIQSLGYTNTQKTFIKASNKLGISLQSMDYTVWNYMANKNNIQLS